MTKEHESASDDESEVRDNEGDSIPRSLTMTKLVLEIGVLLKRLLGV